MALHSVTTLVPLVSVPGYGRVELANTTVTITEVDYLSIPATAFSGGKLTDNGPVADPTDGVVTQAANVAAPVALTSTVAAVPFADLSAAATAFNLLRTDVVNLRSNQVAELTAQTGVGKPMHT